jgi:hypothetical protein
MLKLGIASLALMALASCTQQSPDEDTPRVALQDYVSKSFSVTAATDKAAMLTRLTGRARALLEAWTDDEFKSEFVDKKKTFIKLQIEGVKFLTTDTANVTYELVYLDHTKGRDRDTKVTHRRLAELIKSEGRWQITNVRNIKELIEFRDEMSLP